MVILAGVFSLVIGLAFILPDKRSGEERKGTKWELSLPPFPGPDKGSRAAEDDVFLIKEPRVVSSPG